MTRTLIVVRVAHIIAMLIAASTLVVSCDKREFAWVGIPDGSFVSCANSVSLDELHCIVVDAKQRTRPYLCVRNWDAKTIYCAPDMSRSSP